MGLANGFPDWVAVTPVQNISTQPFGHAGRGKEVGQ
jgi:hypothetical protein